MASSNPDGKPALPVKEGKGVISKIWNNTSKKNKAYETWKIGNDLMGVWDKKMLGKFREGDLVSYTAEINGEYTNVIVAMRLDPSDPGWGKEAAPVPIETGTQAKLETPAKVRIDPVVVRMLKFNALNNASMIAAAKFNEFADDANMGLEVIAIAKVMYDAWKPWVLENGD